MKKAEEAKFQASSAQKIAEEAQNQLDTLYGKMKNMDAKLYDLSEKAKSLTQAAIKAEKQVENDPRSKARNIKTAKNIKQELDEEKAKQKVIGKKKEEAEKKAEESGMTKKQAM